jgi:stearoyl-CoA desaturase (delta-9 desaturase)
MEPITTQGAAADSASAHPQRWQRGLQWPAVLWIALLHFGALAAPFCFTWYGLWIALALSWMTGGLGVCLGYHRLLTHSSFETYRPIRGLLALLGTLAGEGPPIMWVSVHRQHHRFSDEEGDPHSPKEGAWWSHMLWLFPRRNSQQWAQLYRQYSPDLLKEPFLRLLERTFLWWHLLLGAGLLALGWSQWDLPTGVSFLVYGLFVRLVYVLHVTWLVNSASHMWGYRNYETRDNSRNLWWVGLLAFGEGWHNNHHAYPRSAHHGHLWWELDVTYWVIVVMSLTRIAWKVVDRPAESPVPVGELHS